MTNDSICRLLCVVCTIFMIIGAVAAVLILPGCNHDGVPLTGPVDISPDRPCQLDNTGLSHIKAWGTCPNANASCLLRWRPVGSSANWTDNGSDARRRDDARDVELEYMGFCR